LVPCTSLWQVLTVFDDWHYIYNFLTGKKIGDSINETEFVKFLSKKIQGNLTLTSSETQEQSSEYKNAGIVTKVCYTVHNDSWPT
jgi:hypothetical protein